MKQNLRLLTVLVCFASFGNVSAQSPDEVTDNQIREYSARYINHFQTQSAIFSGKVHVPVSPRTEGLYLRPLHERDFDEMGREKFPRQVGTRASYAYGDVEYDGVLYPGVLLRLDLTKDELVVMGPEELHGIVLDPARVGYAEFNGYKVFYINAGDPHYNLPEGYYSELYTGGVHILKKESFLFNRIDNKYTSWSKKFYIARDGEYLRVKKGKGTILKAFGQRRKELDAFIKEKGIQTGKDTETAIIRIAAEYDRLNRN